GLGDAVAPNKGCYPGQEVLEKISALGAPARRLVRIDGEGAAPEIGEKIFNVADVPLEVGQLTSAAATESGFSALALVRKIHAKEGLPVRLGSGRQAAIVRVSPYV
ncbi:MAG: CAF17-like 4Fe-4S cluster assembly/insertion protein YgfZ, partial [Bdellovibrionota bacterium]